MSMADEHEAEFFAAVGAGEIDMDGIPLKPEERESWYRETVESLRAQLAEVEKESDKFEKLCQDMQRTKDALSQQLAERTAQVGRLSSFLRECENNFDCDDDAHKYGTFCRKCEAGEALSSTPSLEELGWVRREEVLGQIESVCREIADTVELALKDCDKDGAYVSEFIRALVKSRQSAEKGEARLNGEGE